MNLLNRLILTTCCFLIAASLVHAQPKVLIVFAHPSAQSFNREILQECEQQLDRMGFEYVVRDLYAIQFDPVLKEAELAHYYAGDTAAFPEEIKKEQAYLLWADHWVFIFPTWWWSMPAMLKGYLDRTLLPAFAFEEEEEQVRPLLKGKQAHLLQSMGASEDFVKKQAFGDQLNHLWSEGVFEFIGAKLSQHLIFYDVHGMGDAYKSKARKEARSLIENLEKARE